VKKRVEAKFGAASVWMLNPGEKQWALPDQGSAKASGADYILMWTRVLEGATGDGPDFDFVYFTGPDDFHRALKLIDTDLMGPARCRIRPARRDRSRHQERRQEVLPQLLRAARVGRVQPRLA